MRRPTTHAWVLTGFLVLGIQFSLADYKPNDEMTFRLVGTGGNCIGCTWTAAEGVITLNTPERLRDYLDEHETGEFVFNSPGGNLVAALQMGLMIREAKGSTSVGRSMPEPEYDGYYSRQPGQCVSACSFAFLGGVARNAAAGVLGVHQFYNEVALEKPEEPIYSALDLSTNQLLSALLINYAVEMGVDPRFISKASSVSPTSVHFLDDQELEEWKVRYDPDLIGEWRIEPWNRGIVAFAKSADERTTATVFCSSDRVPQLMISSPIDFFSEEDFSDPTPGLRSISIFGTPVSTSNVRASFSKGIYKLQARMPGFNPSRLSDEGELSIDADIARVYSTLFYFPMSAKGAKANISAALRNCI